jgi:hypothetical protein
MLVIGTFMMRSAAAATVLESSGTAVGFSNRHVAAAMHGI